MPDARLARARKTLPNDYQFGEQRFRSPAAVVFNTARSVLVTSGEAFYVFEGHAALAIETFIAQQRTGDEAV